MKSVPDSTFVRDAGKKVDWDNIIVGGILAVVFIPFSVMLLIGLWEQSDLALGWAIFIFGLPIVVKFDAHGKISGVIASVYTIAIMTLIWQQSLIGAIAVAVAAVGIEIYQFVAREKSPKKE